MPKWISIRAAARLVGVEPRAVAQRFDRKKNPLARDFARDPDGQILEPRQPLIRLEDLKVEYPGKNISTGDISS